jgi:hypothetical protein
MVTEFDLKVLELIANSDKPGPIDIYVALRDEVENAKDVITNSLNMLREMKYIGITPENLKNQLANANHNTDLIDLGNSYYFMLPLGESLLADHK